MSDSLQAMVVEIVGREGELRSLAEFLEIVPAGPAALVLEGEAGIGKSTLWLAGVDAARERGFRVLASRPAEAEGGLAFAGLGDLFEDVLEEIIPLLPPPRRRALEPAILLEETTGVSIPALSASPFETHWRFWLQTRDFLSPSTTSSGSTAPRQARSPLP